MYASIYELHDRLLAERQKTRAAHDAQLDRERRRKTLLKNVVDVPALEAFVQIDELLRNNRDDSQDDLASLIARYEEEDEEGSSSQPDIPGTLTNTGGFRDGFERMRRCRMALEALDQGGWKRSYHQRLFHEAYIAACARPFWKIDPPGSFARAHQKILDVNNWENLAQEILISTPRRFGKTISVSMFAAALMFSCAGCEVSIYSTCKRISTKLLRNVVMFLGIIYDVLKCDRLKVIRSNQEEVHLQGDEGYKDVRIIQSYPSKVFGPSLKKMSSGTSTLPWRDTYSECQFFAEKKYFFLKKYRIYLERVGLGPPEKKDNGTCPMSR